MCLIVLVSASERDYGGQEASDDPDLGECSHPPSSMKFSGLPRGQSRKHMPLGLPLCWISPYLMPFSVARYIFAHRQN